MTERDSHHMLLAPSLLLDEVAIRLDDCQPSLDVEVLGGRA